MPCCKKGPTRSRLPGHQRLTKFARHVGRGLSRINLTMARLPASITLSKASRSPQTVQVMPGASFQEQPHHLGLPRSIARLQRRTPHVSSLRVKARFDVGALFQQESHNVSVACLRRTMQGRPCFLILEVNLCTRCSSTPLPRASRLHGHDQSREPLRSCVESALASSSTEPRQGICSQGHVGVVAPRHVGCVHQLGILGQKSAEVRRHPEG